MVVTVVRDIKSHNKKVEVKVIQFSNAVHILPINDF